MSSYTADPVSASARTDSFKHEGHMHSQLVQAMTALARSAAEGSGLKPRAEELFAMPDRSQFNQFKVSTGVHVQ